MTSELQADIAILMPKTTDNERFSVRYAGLVGELSKLAVQSCFVESHSSFDADTHDFADPYDINRNNLAPVVKTSLVRDLTMSIDDKPLYEDPTIRTVHDPRTNRFIANKLNVFRALQDFHPATLAIQHTDLDLAFDLIPGNKIVVKPTTGMQSKGVHVLNKTSGVDLEQGTYLAQEFIDTRGGMPEHDIAGVHNLRIISIGNKAVAGIARLGGSASDMLRDDYYGGFVHPDDFSPEVQQIVYGVHNMLATKPGEGNNVIAIDVMRGTDASGETRDVLCEVNRRPLRISPWDLRDPHNLDPVAIHEVSKRWDKAEAEMLAGLVE